MGSDGLAVEQAVDHAVASLAVPLGCHVPDSLESHQPEAVTKCPNTAAVLLAVSSGGIPWPPVLFGRELELLPEFVDPEDGAGVWHCGIAVSRVHHDFVLVERH